jgi:hypothetical protein
MQQSPQQSVVAHRLAFRSNSDNALGCAGMAKVKTPRSAWALLEDLRTALGRRKRELHG